MVVLCDGISEFIFHFVDRRGRRNCAFDGCRGARGETVEVLDEEVEVGRSGESRDGERKDNGRRMEFYSEVVSVVG